MFKVARAMAARGGNGGGGSQRMGGTCRRWEWSGDEVGREGSRG